MIVDGVFKYPKNVVPMGHDKLRNPVPGTTPYRKFNLKQTKQIQMVLLIQVFTMVLIN